MTADRYRFDDASLPERYRNVLRLDTPIPPDAEYVPWLPLSNFIGRVFTGIPAVGAVIFTLQDVTRGTLDLRMWLALFPVFTLPYVCLWYLNRRQKRMLLSLRARGIRLGEVFFDEAVLISRMPEQVTLVRREWVANITVEDRNVFKAVVLYLLLHYRLDGLMKHVELVSGAEEHERLMAWTRGERWRR